MSIIIIVTMPVAAVIAGMSQAGTNVNEKGFQMNTARAVALVTGASSGIGEATAKVLHDAGYAVYGTSRRAVGSADIPFRMIALDVTNEESVASAVARLIQQEGRIDLLVNNAGFGIAPAAAEESSTKQAQAIFDTNFMGAVRMTRAVVPYMRSQGGGRIINIGSILGRVPVPYAALYAGSKHALEGYSEALDLELRGRGIRVSIIEPAYTKTLFEANNIPADSTITEYDVERAVVTEVVSKAMATADSPRVVAEVVLRVARSNEPKLRYTAGRSAAQLRMLRWLLPESLFAKMIRATLKLGATPRNQEPSEALDH